MDIVRFKGGLGNQMFQYAFMEALKDKGREVYASLGYYDRLDTNGRFLLEEIFSNINEIKVIDDMKFREIDKKWKAVKKDPHKLNTFKKNLEERFFFVEENDSVFDDRVFKTSNCTFIGYWQTEKYFQYIKDKVQSIYAFNIHEEKLRSLADKFSNNYFSIHIRRGDYLKDYFKEIYGGICTEQYYQAAAEYIKLRVPNARFIIFSDELEEIRAKINKTENIILFNRNEFEFYQDWYDMYLMSKCRGNIIANSSFSWWGAWLNKCPNKIVIAPQAWLNGKETPDIWCDGWIKM